MNVRYRETVSGGKGFWIFTAAVMVFVGVVTAAAFYFAERGSANWYFAPAVTCMTLLVLLLVLGRVSVEVRDDGISAWLGPVFRKDFSRADIERVEVEPYNWKEFGGWGWKMNMKGASTFSTIGVASALRIYLKNGKAFVITLRDPQACKDAYDRP